jgi:hypothetical protein
MKEEAGGSDLYSFIMAGDFLVKKAGSDTIYITRSTLLNKTQTYVFLIGKE